MKFYLLLLLVSTTALYASACFGGSSKSDPPPPKVLPLLPREDEIIKPKAVTSQQARPPSGGDGARRGSSSSVSTTKLKAFSEQLLKEDDNNVGHLLYLNHQGKTSSAATDDRAAHPLFNDVPQEALSGPTITAMWKLLDNYLPKVTDKEVTNAVEEQEKNDFLNAVMATRVMKTTEKFLKDNGLIRRNLRDVLNEIWFDLYGRSGRNPGSSGFEHVFIGEIKKGKVSGFHNWVTYIHEEQQNDIDYKGFMKYVSLGNKGQILSNRFVWLRTPKPVTSMFVGTSPELEMALYTVCFYARPSGKCPMQLNKKSFTIQTFPYKVGSKNLVGSAFPLI